MDGDVECRYQTVYPRLRKNHDGGSKGARKIGCIGHNNPSNLDLFVAHSMGTDDYSVLPLAEDRVLLHILLILV